MQYFWQNNNIYYCKSKNFPTYLLCTVWYHVLVSEKWHIWTHALYFDKNNLYSVDNTRYHNIFECIYHIVVYRDRFLQCCYIVIQKILYRGISSCYAFLTDESLFAWLPFDVIVYLWQYIYNVVDYYNSLTCERLVFR